MLKHCASGDATLSNLSSREPLRRGYVAEVAAIQALSNDIPPDIFAGIAGTFAAECVSAFAGVRDGTLEEFDAGSACTVWL